MSSVFSKLIDSASARYGVQQETLTCGVAGAATAFYLLKLIYPHIVTRLKEPIQEKSRQSYTKHNRHNTVIVRDNSSDNNSTGNGGRKQRLSFGLDRDFFRQLIKLLKIMVPGWRSREMGLLACATLTLLARTFLSVYVAELEGQIVKRIVLRDIHGFSLMLARWFVIALPATFVNSAIRYLEGRLALSFRERLVKHAYKMYLSQQTYYRVSALDTRLGGAEQRLTDDLSELASSVAHLYSSLTKPLLDCALVGIALMSFSHKMGAKTIPGPLLAAAVIALTGQVLRFASPKFGQLVAEEATRRGKLREAHARISAHAEEIAFYGGHDTEHRYLNSAYKSLVMHLHRILAVKLWYVMLEQFLMKYVWSGTGLLVIAMPLLYNTATSGSRIINTDGDGGVGERTRYLTTSKNLLSSGADAVERLMSSYKELVALAGYAARVSEMLDVFKDAALCKYKRNVVTSSPSRSLPNGNAEHLAEKVIKFNNGTPIIKGIVRESTDGSISLINVPIVTPNCEVIVPNLTVHIKPGDHLLITGPNGCGKSSLFRIISGLWPVYDGTLIRPAERNFSEHGRPALFYIPQKPYMTVGCLRDQIIYPAHSRLENCSDEKLLQLLDDVDLRSIVEREPEGFDTLGDWDSTLSGGEKQRLAMTRLFYHAPQYALLDECTSAVSLEAEGIMYETAKKKGITLLTITHRVASLAKYHKLLLKFDGEGGWTFGPLDMNGLPISNRETNKEEAEQEEAKTSHYHMLHELRDIHPENTYVGIS
ncbi:ATP-binding cassette sub-family D member [Monomorium pharaonis]|uniref:ATP-binding cassette sub-family D member n=1 Tax=Monomorium pharaonis TaxID=307658 RepID=UPI00063F0629|nr:ATP-binding cassette sub-family D member [Monomorium pharaonis]